MDGAHLCRFPHLSWLRFPLRVPAGGRRLALHMRGVACGVSIALQGSRAASQITYGRELKWRESVGMVSFVPPDGEQHTYLMTSDAGCELFVALIPQGHVKQVTALDGVLASHEWSPVLASNDTVVRYCMALLAVGLHAHESDMDVAMDEAARRLILRIAQLNGDGPPDWHDDCSLFDRRTLLGLVAYVDEHLRLGPSLMDMAMREGMSPSHFAKKFRQSTGLSLQRFINQRRILRSLETLKSDLPLASIALDLGFSSQSHFTRLFSDLTGMTPAKYRKQSRRTVG